MTLLMLCLSSMMMAIWMKRSVMQPLGWHCEGQRVVSLQRDSPARGLFGRGRCRSGEPGIPRLAGQQGRESGTAVRAQNASRPGPHLLQPPPASDAHVVPRVAVDPVTEAPAARSEWC